MSRKLLTSQDKNYSRHKVSISCRNINFVWPAVNSRDGSNLLPRKEFVINVLSSSLNQITYKEELTPPQGQ